MGRLKLNKNEFSFLNGLEIDKQVTGNNTHSKLRVEKKNIHSRNPYILFDNENKVLSFNRIYIHTTPTYHKTDAIILFKYGKDHGTCRYYITRDMCNNIFNYINRERNINRILK